MAVLNRTELSRNNVNTQTTKIDVIIHITVVHTKSE